MGSALINSICSIMEKEYRVYEDMLKVSNSKKNAIIKGRITDLEKLLEIEQSLIVKAGRIGAEREELVENLAVEYGIDKEKISVSALEELVEKEEAEMLGDTRKRFMGVLGQLQDVNRLNSSLVKNSLEYIDFSINLLSLAEAGSGGYERSGKATEAKGKNFLDMTL